MSASPPATPPSESHPLTGCEGGGGREMPPGRLTGFLRLPTDRGERNKESNRCEDGGGQKQAGGWAGVIREDANQTDVGGRFRLIYVAPDKSSCTVKKGYLPL